MSNLNWRGPRALGRRWAAILAVLVCSATAATTPTHAQSGNEWTWSSATHPAGTAAVAGGASGAGVWQYEGIFYVPGVGHMSPTHGQWREEQAPTGTGGLGYVSHTTGLGNRPDLSLIATGTMPLSPYIRVSDAWPQAPISDVAHGGDILKGQTVCHSGQSVFTVAAGTYRCGVVTATCTRPGKTCWVENPRGLLYGGDSGGAVWRYDGRGGVVLLGWVSAGAAPKTAAGDYTWMMFVPTWALQDHEWTLDQTWNEWGFPSGTHATGCFVTTQGCLRA